MRVHDGSNRPERPADPPGMKPDPNFPAPIDAPPAPPGYGDRPDPLAGAVMRWLSDHAEFGENPIRLLERLWKCQEILARFELRGDAVPTVATLAAVGFEVARARTKHPESFHSSHEGYAVILEELDELWSEVKAQTDARSFEKMRKEAIQIACTAIRFVEEICDRRIAR